MSYENMILFDKELAKDIGLYGAIIYQELIQMGLCKNDKTIKMQGETYYHYDKKELLEMFSFIPEKELFDAFKKLDRLKLIDFSEWMIPNEYIVAVR